MKQILFVALGTLVPVSLLAGITRMKPDAKTSFLIQPDMGEIVDVSKRIPADKIKVVGVKVEEDPVSSAVYVFEEKK